MKPAIRLSESLLLLCAMLLLLTVSVTASDAGAAAQAASAADSAVSAGTKLTVYPDGTSEMPEPYYSAPEKSSEDEIHLPDPAESRPVILIVSIAVLAVVIPVSVLVEKKHRDRS